MSNKKESRKVRSAPISVKISPKQLADVLAGRDRAYRIGELQERMKARSATTIYRWVDAGFLPPPVRMGVNRSVWLESQIAAIRTAAA